MSVCFFLKYLQLTFRFTPEAAMPVGMTKPYTTSATRSCQYCGHDFNAKGHYSHKKACRIQFQKAQRISTYENHLAAERSGLDGSGESYFIERY